MQTENKPNEKLNNGALGEITETIESIVGKNFLVSFGKTYSPGISFANYFSLIQKLASVSLSCCPVGRVCPLCK